MRVYRVICEKGPFGAIDVQIPRSEIVAIKKQIKADGVEGYSKMLHVMAFPAAVYRYCMIPGTKLLHWLLMACIKSRWLILVLAVALLFLRLWWWSLGLAVFYFLVISNIQTTLNYEIGARLFALDQHLKMRLGPSE